MIRTILPSAALVAAFVSFTGVISAQPSTPQEPAWWSASATKIWQTTPVNLDNNRPVNVGQLKHVAAMARIYFDTMLLARGVPDGAGPRIRYMVDGGGPANEPGFALDANNTVNPANKATANVGQLKRVASAFYIRLAEVDPIASASIVSDVLVRMGLPSNHLTHPAPGIIFPWLDAPASEDTAPATIGQLKVLFGFDLGAFPAFALDSDSDGLADSREIELGLNPQLADTNGDGTPDFDPDKLDNPDIDSDKDGLKNGEDAVPWNAALHFKRVPESRYAVVPLGEGVPLFINNQNEVLISDAYNTNPVSSGARVWNAATGASRYIKLPVEYAPLLPSNGLGALGGEGLAMDMDDTGRVLLDKWKKNGTGVAPDPLRHDILIANPDGSVVPLSLPNVVDLPGHINHHKKGLGLLRDGRVIISTGFGEGGYSGNVVALAAAENIINVSTPEYFNMFDLISNQSGIFVAKQYTGNGGRFWQASRFGANENNAIIDNIIPPFPQFGAEDFRHYGSINNMKREVCGSGPMVFISTSDKIGGLVLEETPPPVIVGTWKPFTITKPDGTPSYGGTHQYGGERSRMNDRGEWCHPDGIWRNGQFHGWDELFTLPEGVGSFSPSGINNNGLVIGSMVTITTTEAIYEPVVLIPVDLAVDSDNNDGFNPPRRDEAEEAKEDYLTSQKPARENPGKYVKLSFGDFDNDGIPDFADGMDVHGGSGANKCGKFIPMVADLSGVKTITGAKVRFNYTEANPTGIIKQNVPTDIPAWSPGAGDLRLWKKNGNEERKVSDVKSNGDFVKANTEYTIQELGPDPEGTLTLYVEALRKSLTAADIAVAMQVKLDGQNWIEADKVRFTAIPRVLYGSPNSSLTPLPGSKIEPAFEDETVAIGEALGGIIGGVGQDTLSIGRYGPHPNAGSDPTKDRQRLVIRLQTGTESFTKGEDSIVLLVAEGLSGGFTPPALAAGASGVTQFAAAGFPQQAPAPANAAIPEADAPEDWEAQFERILFEKYEEATPRIEDLERDGFELWGWLYGGRSYEFFSGREVWRSGSKIFIEDSLTPEQAADAYYNFLKQALPTDAQGVNLTPILRYYGEIYEAAGEDRAKVGQFMAKHWELVETTTGMLESEYLFTPLSFAVGGVLQIRRVNNMTFYTEGKVFAIPLVRRNWARGNITENDTLVNSLGFSRNAGLGAIKVTGSVNGQPKNYVPDSIRPHWYIEVKDWKSLSKTSQIQAAFSAATSAQKRVAIIITTRNRRLSQPLLDFVETQGGLLLRRNLNTDAYEVWRWDTTKLWEPIDKATVIQWLSTP